MPTDIEGNFEREGVQKMSWKFDEFLLSRCEDIARLLYQNLLGIKELNFKKGKNNRMHCYRPTSPFGA